MNKIHLIICLLAGMYFHSLWDLNNREEGESRHYVASTVTLLNSCRISFTKQDIRSVEDVFGKLIKYNYPRYAASDSTLLHTLATNDAKSPDFMGRSYYWGTYSFLCIPIYCFCRLFHIFESNMFNAFKLTNIVMLLIPMLIIVFYFHGSFKMKLLLLSFAATTPAAQYINWASAEICIYMFVMLYLIFLYNKQYYLSALCLAFGATLNYCLMPLGLYLLWIFLKDMQKDYYDETTGKFLFTPVFFKKLGLLFSCFLPVFHAAFVTYLQFGSIATMSGMRDYKYLISRFFAYMFDLNFGILIYYHIFLCLFIIFMPFWFIRKKWELFIGGLAFLGIVILYSIMGHINCGMEGIARYSCWSAPVMAFLVIDQLSRMKWDKFFYALCGAIFLLNSSILLIPLHTTYLAWGKIAELVLSHFPQCYNPLYSTFISRGSHIDGGYSYSSPVVFSNNNKFKILCSRNDLEKFWSFFRCNDKSVVDSIDQQRKKHLQENNDPYVYINGSSHFSALYNRFLPYDSNQNENPENRIYIPPQRFQFGPCTQMPKGHYKIIIRGENLKCLDFFVYYNFRNNTVHKENLSKTNGKVSYDIVLENDVSNIEFFSKNNSQETAAISSILWRQMDEPKSNIPCLWRLKYFLDDE